MPPRMRNPKRLCHPFVSRAARPAADVPPHKAAVPGCGTMAPVAAEHRDSVPVSPPDEDNGGRLAREREASGPGVAARLAAAAGPPAGLDWIPLGLFAPGPVRVAHAP